MKSPITVGIMLLLILGVFGGVAITPVAADAVMTISEFQISTDPAEQSEPDIDDLHIVYQDNRNGNWDIYLYTLQGTFIPETRITTNTANQQFPAISGNRIVWQDNRNGNWDIYLYDIGTQTETQITTSTANQQFPAISGNRIVWQDERNGDSDIYLYDINTQTETLLTRSCYPNPCPSKYPAIYGDKILYQKTWAPSYSWVPCLFKVDPATKSETYLTVWVNNNNNPDIAIYENRVVWTTYEYIYDGYHTSIWMYDLNTGSMTRLTETWHVTYDEGHPDTHGTAPAYVVYYDNRNRYWGPNMQYFNNADVFVLNLDAQTETLVTNNTADQVNPAIYGGRIVYMDNRNGNWDIYMAMLGWVMPTATARLEYPNARTRSDYPDANWTRPVYPDANWTRPVYPDANWARSEYPDANWTRPVYPDANWIRPDYPDVPGPGLFPITTLTAYYEIYEGMDYTHWTEIVTTSVIGNITQLNMTTMEVKHLSGTVSLYDWEKVNNVWDYQLFATCHTNPQVSYGWDFYPQVPNFKANLPIKVLFESDDGSVVVWTQAMLRDF